MLSMCDLMCVVAEGNEFYGQKLACLELEMDGWMLQLLLFCGLDVCVG